MVPRNWNRFLVALTGISVTFSLLVLYRTNVETLPASCVILQPNTSTDLMPRKESLNVNYKRVFYNRVPKCGSTSVTDCYLQNLTTVKIISDGMHFNNRYIPQLDLQKRIAEKVLKGENSDKPTIFHTHLFFIDFDSVGEQQWPVYVNLIRDPVDRKISRFYFDRIIYKYVKLYQHYNLSQEYLTQTLEHCLEERHKECVFNETVELEANIYNATWQWVPHYIEGMLPFFCGHKPQCRYPFARGTLNEAMSNVNKYYLVVGILEELAAFLKMLEELLPYLHGIQDVTCEVQKNLNKQKPKVEDWVKQKLKDDLSIEYEFYEFIKQRFCTQYKQLFPRDRPLSSCSGQKQ